MKKIETRMDELRTKTANPQEMLWRYLATDVLKKWVEEFADPDTGEVVQITRSEIMFKRGTHLSPEKISEIQFFQQCGDIGEIEISNQQRVAEMVTLGGLSPWSVSAQFQKSKKRFLLYANSVQMAIDVCKDFVELNFAEHFYIQNVRNFTDCIIIKDEETDGTEDEEELQVEKKFYQIDVCVKTENGQYTSSFVIRDKDVDSCMVRIEKFIREQMQERAEKRNEPLVELFETAIERAIAITCSNTIEKEFSMAYIKAES